MHTQAEALHSMPEGEANPVELTGAFIGQRQEVSVLPKTLVENRLATKHIRANPRPWSALNE